MTPEARIKKQVQRVLVDAKVYFFLPFGGGYGRAGIGDICGCKKGRFISIECKAGNKEPTALQARELERVAAAGGIALVVNETNINQLKGIIDAI